MQLIHGSSALLSHAHTLKSTGIYEGRGEGGSGGGGAQVGRTERGRDGDGQLGI